MTENAAPPADNTLGWWEIPVQDLEKAKPFYAAVFGWEFQPFGEGYAGVLANGALIGGMSQSDEDIINGIRIYINVADIEATLAKAADNGGAVKTQRTEVGGDMGWWANFTDSQGRLIGLASGNPAAS